ncbi:MAG: hypothetical protein KH142_10315, partial [Slackia piriformis]|nr:hypothetical protein [Slackia piriformis]
QHGIAHRACFGIADRSAPRFGRLVFRLIHVAPFYCSIYYRTNCYSNNRTIGGTIRAETVERAAGRLTDAKGGVMVSAMFSSVVKIYRHARLLNDFASSEAVFVMPDATSLSAMLI